MTDTYGNDPHDQDHPEGHDHETPSSEAETWHGDQPPVDDFADHPAGEGSATVSEETAQPQETDGGTVAPKKSSMLLPVAAAVGGVLFLGVILYWQFGASHGAAPTPPPMSMASDTPPAATPPAAAGSIDINNLKPQNPPQDVAPTTAMENPTVPAAAPNAMGQTGSAMPNGMPPQPPAPAMAIPPQIPPVSPQPAPQTANIVSAPPSLAMPAPTMPVQPNMGTAGMPQPGAAISQSTETRLDALSAHVDDLQKSLAQATQQLGQISNMLAANPPGSGANNSLIEDRLNKLEQQLMQMQQHEMPAVMASPTPSSTPASTHKTHASKSQYVKPAHAKTAARRHKESGPASAPASSRLVIRAAAPGEAWVAKDATTRELRPVHVGDELPGIGRVEGIHQNGDNWVIQGSRGTLD